MSPPPTGKQKHKTSAEEAGKTTLPSKTVWVRNSFWFKSLSCIHSTSHAHHAIYKTIFFQIRQRIPWLSIPGFEDQLTSMIEVRQGATPEQPSMMALASASLTGFSTRVKEYPRIQDISNFFQNIKISCNSSSDERGKLWNSYKSLNPPSLKEYFNTLKPCSRYLN